MEIVLRNGEVLIPSYRPLSELDLWDSLAREMADSWIPVPFGDMSLPGMDIYEEKGELVVKTELPGIDQKDLEVSLEGDRLTIKAEKKEEVKKGAKKHARERYYGQYFRSITLPHPVKEDQVSASFEKGVLELRLPRGEEPKTKKIAVKAQLPEGETKKPEVKSRKKKAS
jgi:HSP20 family protein